MYNRPSLRKAFGAGAVTLLATNVALLVPGVGGGFLTMLFTSGLTTPLYWYALIPLLTIIALTVVNIREVMAAFRTRTILART